MNVLDGPIHLACTRILEVISRRSTNRHSEWQNLFRFRKRNISHFSESCIGFIRSLLRNFRGPFVAHEGEQRLRSVNTLHYHYNNVSFHANEVFGLCKNDTSSHGPECGTHRNALNWIICFSASAHNRQPYPYSSVFAVLWLPPPMTHCRFACPADCLPSHQFTASAAPVFTHIGW